MCQCIYLSSEKELPEVPWNENAPGFYLMKETDEGILKMIQPLLKHDNIYSALSFMGCACGLNYGDWTKNDHHSQRKQDVKNFISFLNHHKSDNNMELFSTSWHEFPDEYEKGIFTLNEPNEEEFELQELVVFSVK
jgi:hypothetical protein